MSTNLFDNAGKALSDASAKTVLSKGTTVPVDATAGYVTGALFLKIDGTSGNALYINEGSTTSSAFVPVIGGSATLTPTSADTAGVNVILPSVTKVRLGANVNGVNDFVTLPSLANVPNGHEITIIAGAANCEVRTPATSAEEINSENCDGTKEYLLTATQIHKFIKIDNTIGWMGHGYSAIGAVVTAVIPD